MDSDKKNKSNNDIDKTKAYKTKNINKKTKTKTKNKKEKKPSKHPKLKLALKIIGILILLLCIIGAGMVAGLFLGWFGSDFKITKDDLLINYSNSTIVDANGETIAVLSAEENRQIITKSEMSKYLPDAFVSIEDERFYSHHGVDIKRTAAATFTFAVNNGSSSFGGSTITQQLIKNITNEKDDSGLAGVKRKVGEMTKAYQVENILSKDQILEMYLNIIFLGQQNYGVETASIFYFNKNASDLTLAESAFLAGITHSPNAYNPYGEENKTEKITKRTTTVLDKMLQLGKVTKEEYDAAIAQVNAGFDFKQGTVAMTSYSYHTEATINQIINQLVEEKGMDKEYAKTYLYGGGFTIYTTQDTSIQHIVEEEHLKSTYIKPSKKNKGETTQAATVIIDPKTGYVVGTAGGLGEKTAFGLNRATQTTRQTGSSMKPIAVIAPSLEAGLINAGTVVDDIPMSFGNYKPKNYYAGYKGLSNIRYMIRISQNITEVQLLQKLTPQKSIEFMKKLGISSFVMASENAQTNDEGLGIALGGLTKGVSPLEMAAAYATIANDGVYIEPTFYTKIVDSNGKTILECNQETHRVLSEGNAFIMKTILKEPIGPGGTGTGAAISGMDVSGKTGTTNDDADGWFCGFTPYYAGATWYGYDKDKEAVKSSTSTTIWAGIMKNIHKNLPGKRYEQPSSIVTASICKDSGLLATELCALDQRGTRAYSEYFVKGTVPSKTCTTHVKAEICEETGKPANEHCEKKVERIFITRPNSDQNKSWQNTEDAKYMLPTEKCDIHTEAPKDAEKPVITLNGAASITLKVGETYKEEGARATDNKDGDLTDKIQIEGTVNTNNAGTYTIKYTVTDSSGNVTTVTRTVTVISNTTNNNTNTNTNTNTDNQTNTTQNNTTNPSVNNTASTVQSN